MSIAEALKDSGTCFYTNICCCTSWHILSCLTFEFLLNVLPHCHLGTILKLVLHFHCCPQTVPSAHVVEIPYLTFLLVTYLLFCLSLSCARQHLCLQQQTLRTERTFKKILMPCIFSVSDIHEIRLTVLQSMVVQKQ